MVTIRRPARSIGNIGLVTPGYPILTGAAREQFQIGTRAARFDEGILLIRLAGVLALAGREQIDLPPSGRESAGISSLYTKQDQLGDIAEVKSDTPAIRTTILANLMPNEI